ncbi:TMEM175 family protein [Plantactinospora siamensis]|uniref:TMEM175 family protein n=1 Tax=Plantactinospora siamensis TaxID=555372 RepID=A0ABV6NVR7_9ACTN
MRTNRVEAFSDGVFAIAITLLVLEIRVPEDMTSLGPGLLALWPSYLAYGISFLLIGLVWANHHVMLDKIHRVDRMLLFLNTLLLANVAALPFTTAVLARAVSSGHGQRTAVAVYGGWLVVGGIFFNAVWLWALRRPELLEPGVDRSWTAAVARRFLLGPALYAVGTVLAFFAWRPAIALFAALIVLYWLPISEWRSRGRPGGRAASVRPPGAAGDDPPA